MEGVRDMVFAEKTVSFRNMPLAPEWGLDLLVTREYHPMFNQDHKVIGIMTFGFSRTPHAPDKIEALRAIVSALECQEFPSELCAESRLLEPYPEGSSGLQRLAQRLRRFLPPLLH